MSYLNGWLTYILHFILLFILFKRTPNEHLQLSWTYFKIADTNQTNLYTKVSGPSIGWGGERAGGSPTTLDRRHPDYPAIPLGTPTRQHPSTPGNSRHP